MGLVSGYHNDVFISYSHLDNQPFGDSRGGWVDIFHEQLQNFVNVHVGRRTTVWRDRRLTGAEVFSDEIEQQLRSSAVLISVMSPGYLQSDWCNRGLVGFIKAAQDRGNLRVGNLQRAVKVLRRPVERSVLPPVLDDVLGSQFYRVDPASGAPVISCSIQARTPRRYFLPALTMSLRTCPDCWERWPHRVTPCRLLRQLPPPTRCFWPGPPAT